VNGVGYLAVWGVPQLDLQVGAPYPLTGCVRWHNLDQLALAQSEAGLPRAGAKPG